MLGVIFTLISGDRQILGYSKVLQRKVIKGVYGNKGKYSCFSLTQILWYKWR